MLIVWLGARGGAGAVRFGGHEIVWLGGRAVRGSGGRLGVGRRVGG